MLAKQVGKLMLVDAAANRSRKSCSVKSIVRLAQSFVMACLAPGWSGPRWWWHFYVRHRRFARLTCQANIRIHQGDP